MDVRNPVQAEMGYIVIFFAVAEEVIFPSRGYHFIRTYQIGVLPAGMELEIGAVLVIGERYLVLCMNVLTQYIYGIENLLIYAMGQSRQVPDMGNLFPEMLSAQTYEFFNQLSGLRLRDHRRE